MLVNDNSPVLQLKKQDERLSDYDIECWINEQHGFKMHVFSVLIDDTEQLFEVWNPITSSIATYFQPELEKDIERWNIYVTFIVQQKVDKKLKYRIEQDRFSSRKLVLDSLYKTKNQDLQILLNEKIFSFTMESESKRVDQSFQSIESLLQNLNPNLLKIIKTTSENKKDTNQLLQDYMG